MKPLTQRQRWIVLGGLLTVTLAAGLMIDDDEPPAKTRKKSDRPAASRSAKGEPPAKVEIPLVFPVPATGAPQEKLAVDPFRVKSWYIAPPPPPPPKPKAPPLPFQYLGKVIEGNEIKVFLLQQGKHLIVKQGDKIDASYQVEEVRGGMMTFVYLPLQEKQTLAIGQEK